eukprot:2786753-Pleurochrysis_carterae.AAC.1
MAGLCVRCQRPAASGLVASRAANPAGRAGGSPQRRRLVLLESRAAGRALVLPPLAPVRPLRFVTRRRSLRGRCAGRVVVPPRPEWELHAGTAPGEFARASHRRCL